MVLVIVVRRKLFASLPELEIVKYRLMGGVNFAWCRIFMKRMLNLGRSDKSDI